jgi:hypothetical protein
MTILLCIATMAVTGPAGAGAPLPGAGAAVSGADATLAAAVASAPPPDTLGLGSLSGFS